MQQTEIFFFINTTDLCLFKFQQDNWKCSLEAQLNFWIEMGNFSENNIHWTLIDNVYYYVM